MSSTTACVYLTGDLYLIIALYINQPSTERDTIWKLMRHYGILANLISIIKDTYNV